MIKDIIDNLLKFLPHNYSEDTESNLGKLINVIKNELTEINDEKNNFLIYQDVDEAYDHYLDLIGDSVGQPRTADNDSYYRLLIKSKIQQNISGGDIPTANKVFSLILGENYLGIEEGWDNTKYDNEPALVVINYKHEIIEEGINPAEPIRLDGSVLLNGDYLLNGKEVGYFENEIINFAKVVGKRIIAAGVKVIWKAPVDMETNPAHINDVSFNLTHQAQSDVTIEHNAVIYLTLKFYDGQIVDDTYLVNDTTLVETHDDLFTALTGDPDIITGGYTEI